MERVIIIDASQLLTIMRRTGVDGLSALHRRGDYFFFSVDLKKELLAAREWKSKNGKRLQDWLDEQRVNGRLIESKERVTPEEYKIYDLEKRGTSRGGKELSDMSIRKFMLKNKGRFTFEVISRDLGLLNHQVDDPAHPLFGLQFDRLSTRSALTWLATHPDVPHNPERLQSLLQALHNGKFDLSKDRGIATHELERETYRLPETYEDAVRERAHRAETDPKRRSDIRGFSSQADGQFGGAPVDPGTGVRISPSDTPLDGLSGGPIDPSAGISGKAKGSLTEGPGIGRRFMNLARNGAPALVLGLAVVPVFSMVQARAAERNIPFDQAARELGIEFGEDELKELAAGVGIDLAVSLTPIGAVKKAWDVLGNIDDIVAVTQLYGAAYPDNETIQKMAGIADAVEDTEVFGAYVEGRDALTGIVGGAIDWIFSSSPDEDQLAGSLEAVRETIEAGNGAVVQAVEAGASQDEVTEIFRSEVAARAAVLTSSAPLRDGTAPLSAPVPQVNSLSPETALPGDGNAPLSGVPIVPGSQAIPSASFEAASDAGNVPSGAASAKDPLARKTSYDTYKRLGTSPEEEAAGVEEYYSILRQSYVEMNGHMEAAEILAMRRFKRIWNLSAFAPVEEGTIVRNPVETVYSDVEKNGHGYVREEAEELLSSQGISAARWYLSPNEMTERDKRLGKTDSDGYGPRMTLSYDDATGARHKVTDSFQANVKGASQRKKALETQTLYEDLKAAYDRRMSQQKDTPMALMDQAPLPKPKPQSGPAG
ncbi:MAG: hypothetical protein K5905_10770 [Roseibium sp.]|uniref:hypothetical protein n=1 Tax=Roseibium sp. TaxID=1936156 RepID=UPI00261A8B75|nr:hypothetical protein [Roseibium sp.]MCV0425947.1 hypothetical protein [Roseibium sp.]